MTVTTYNFNVFVSASQIKLARYGGLWGDSLVAFLVLALQFIGFFTLYHNPGDVFVYFYEYGNIAESIVKGQGYGNVFGTESGPTAWTLPGFVFVIVLIYLIFGVKTSGAFWASLSLEYALTALTVFVLLQLLRFTPFARHRYWVVPVFLTNIALFHAQFLNDFNDLQCMLCITTLALYSLVLYFKQGNGQWLPLLALLLPLFNPAVAFAFAVVFTVGILMQLKEKGRGWKVFSRQSLPVIQKPLKIVTWVIVAFSLSTGLWIINNHQLFGRIIPSKSNIWYEFYQSNVLDHDGILSISTMVLFHPNSLHPDKRERNLYTRLGETKYLKLYEQRSEVFFANHPEIYWQKVINRLKWAFVWSNRSVEDFDYHPPIVSLLPEDSTKLVQAKLISYRANSTSNGRWLCLWLDEEVFLAQILPLHLRKQSALIQDWREAKEHLLKLDWRPGGILKGTLYSLVPSLILILGLLSRSIRQDPVFLIMAGFMLVYLLPYLAVAYYFRYQLPLIGLYSTFFLYLVHILVIQAKALRLTLVKRNNSFIKTL